MAEQGNVKIVQSKAETKSATKAAGRAPAGAWVVVNEAGVVLSVEQSETRALRIAVKEKADVVRWPFGALRDAVLAGLPPAVKP
jgi:hypothetical protein